MKQSPISTAQRAGDAMLRRGETTHGVRTTAKTMRGGDKERRIDRRDAKRVEKWCQRHSSSCYCNDTGNYSC